MARKQGKETTPPTPSSASDPSGEDEGKAPLPALPELLRRAAGIGFSGFFLTEAAIRKALGDTLPKDWIDFAVEQSERTRAEFIERLSYEVARNLENIDPAALLSTLLEGRTVEVKAEIRLGKKDDRSETGIRIEVNGKRER